MVKPRRRKRWLSTWKSLSMLSGRIRVPARTEAESGVGRAWFTDSEAGRGRETWFFGLNIGRRPRQISRKVWNILEHRPKTGQKPGSLAAGCSHGRHIYMHAHSVNMCSSIGPAIKDTIFGRRRFEPDCFFLQHRGGGEVLLSYRCCGKGFLTCRRR